MLRMMRLLVFALALAAACGGEAMAPPTVLTGNWEIADDACFFAANYRATTYSTAFSCRSAGFEITQGNYRVSGDELIVERVASSCRGISRDASGKFSISGDVLSIYSSGMFVAMWSRVDHISDASAGPTGCWSDDGLNFTPLPLADL